MAAALGTQADGTMTPRAVRDGSASLYKVPRTCRDCGLAVPGRALYCDRHRDLRRVATFLHQARLIAETGDHDNPLAARIRLALREVERQR